MNQDLGNVADEELGRFEEGCKTFCNLIKAELSGKRGENKAFQVIDHVKSNHFILKNVELEYEESRTELDSIVITPNGLTIVEVKNTARNIFIDEEGKYFRIGEFLKKDYNIAQKMDLKEEILRKTLSKSGIENVSINKLIVFTDDHIEVHNMYTKLRTCFVSQLPCIIYGFKSQTYLTLEEMETVNNIIKQAEQKQAYPLKFDVTQYKQDFATIMAILELKAVNIEDKPIVEELIKDNNSEDGNMYGFNNIFESRYVGYAGSVVAGLVIAAIATKVGNSIRK